MRNLKLTSMLVLPLFVIAMAAGPAPAAEKNKPNPYLKPDDSFISINGTVEKVQRDRFTLDYGEGIVTVEFDDGDRDADAYKLAKGDKVTVNGLIDDDFLEMTKIEASSVYVENLGTTFFASAADEEDWVVVSTPIIVSDTILQGTVTSVSEEEFMLNTGVRKIRVEVDEMAYNPLDDVGYQKVRIGDRVRVMGEIDNDLFEGREFEAKALITLTKRKAQKSQAAQKNAKEQPEKKATKASAEKRGSNEK